VAKRLPASVQTDQSIRQLLSGGSAGDVRSELIRLGVRRIVEEALEREVSDFLGRSFYQREGGGEVRGYRNGYRSGHLDSAEGQIPFAVPQVSDTSDEAPFESKIRQHVKGRSEQLEHLATEMFARGLSTRDIEAAFRDEEGNALLSRSAVSDITEVLWQQYEAFATRDLSGCEIAYLFMDGVAERLNPGERREAVLCAWGIDVEGNKHLLHLAPGTKEDTASCKAFIQDMKRRGLNDPLLATTDGAPGLIKAVEECFPRSSRQRCLVHKMRNIQVKVTDEQLWPEVKAEATSVYQAANPETARMLRDGFVKRWSKKFPTAVACFEEDFEACIAQLLFPITHRRAIRSTNLLERLFEENRRRTKVLPHAFGERPMLKLMFAAVIRAAEKWRKLKVTNFEREQLRQLREEMNEKFKRRHAPAATPTPSAFSSKVGT
jgi:transposase-like protein